MSTGSALSWALASAWGSSLQECSAVRARACWWRSGSPPSSASRSGSGSATSRTPRPGHSAGSSAPSPQGRSCGALFDAAVPASERLSWSPLLPSRWPCLRSYPSSATWSFSRCHSLPSACAAAGRSATQGSAPWRTSAPPGNVIRVPAGCKVAPVRSLAPRPYLVNMDASRVRGLACFSRGMNTATSPGGARARKLVLVVIDGLTPEVFEQAVERRTAPTLAELHAAGSYARAASTFPSLTPVCMATLATGAHPDVHEIPHLVWYHRGEGRLVEYGSSFPAMRAAGARRALQDAVFEMTRSHLAPEATTVFEALDDAGLVTAAINFTCYRGRTRHAIRLPEVMRRNRWFESVDGPTRFFFFNLFESDPTGAPLAIRSRTRGSIDSYAAVVGRWLVTRDGFDFLVFYLPDFDYASHAVGPEAALDALERADSALAELLRAAGGVEDFLERYAILVCSDHGQTPVEHVAALGDRFAGAERDAVVVTASNRAGMIYRLPGCGFEARQLAERLDDEAS